MDIRSLRGRARAVLSAATAPADDKLTAPAQPHALSILEPHEKQIIADVRYYTMVSNERLLAIIDAVKYLVERGVPGSLVECGVWRGGSVLTMIKTLQLLDVHDRDVYLFDTFEGMTPPTAADTSPFEQSAVDTWQQTPNGVTPWHWAFDSKIYDFDFVKGLILSSGYPPERIHFVKGPVEETLPAQAPSQAALVRLDTDWYASTIHELDHLYPLLEVGGVLIIDDFGHWDGARKAVEEYFERKARPILFSRTDYTGRMGVKL